MARRITKAVARKPAVRGRAVAAAATLPPLPPVPLDQVRPVDAPAFWASTVQIAYAGNDIFMTFSRPRPAVMLDGNAAPIALPETVAIMHMSLATVKDLSVVLADLVGKIETAHGPIETEFTRSKAMEKTQPKH